MIRLATIDDLEAISKIEDESFREEAWSKKQFEEELAKSFAKIYVSVDQGIINGYIGIWEIDKKVEITTIAVKKECQGKGIGSRLLDEVLKEDLVNATLEVRVSNEKAINLYKKKGFEIWAIRKNYYQNEDGYLMGKGNING